MTMLKQNKTKKIHQDILFVLISSLVVVIVWIGSNLYHISITSTISEDVQKQLTPIDGTFDLDTIQKLKNREQVSPAFEIQTPASQSAPTTPIQPTESFEQASDSSRFAPTDTPINRQGQ